ncbi:MAG: hypothetical protein ACFNYI_01155, partial [Eubacterium sp.]
ILYCKNQLIHPRKEVYIHIKPYIFIAISIVIYYSGGIMIILQFAAGQFAFFLNWESPNRQKTPDQGNIAVLIVPAHSCCGIILLFPPLFHQFGIYFQPHPRKTTVDSSKSAFLLPLHKYSERRFH